MESSDESFTWTNASYDSDSDAMAIENTKKSTPIEYDGESESGSSYKKKLQKKLFREEQNSSYEKEHKKSKKRKIKEEHSDSETNESSKRKRIKVEPESDADVKIRMRTSPYMNGSEEFSHSNDDSYLDLRVKEEQASFATPNPVKPKKTKKVKSDPNISLDSENQADSSISDTTENKKKYSIQSMHSECDSEINGVNEEAHLTEDGDKQVKTKKKSKKIKDSSINNDSDLVVEDKCVAEDTVVEKPRKKQKKKRESICETSFSDVALENSVEIVRENKTSISEHQLEAGKNSSREGSPVADVAGCNSTMNTSRAVVQNNISAVNNDTSGSEQTETYKHKSKYSNINKKLHRLSDRIRFEDEDVSELDSSHMYGKNILPSKVKHFVQTNNYLRPISSMLTGDSIVSENDEIWILKCPRESDVAALKGMDLIINNKSKIKFGGHTYDGSLDEEPGCIAMLSSLNNKLIMEKLSFKGTVNFRKRIPKPHIPEDNVIVNNQTNFIPLPDTKCRHPLFGPDYKRAMKIAPAVLDKLKLTNGESVDSLDSTRKKKKKKHKKAKSEPLEEENMPTTKPEPELESHTEGEHISSSKKKKRKRKHSEETDTAPRKAKRVKRDRNSAEVWESEKAIEENLFNF